MPVRRFRPMAALLLGGALSSATFAQEPPEQGLYMKAVPFFDYTYGTRTPISHRVHVGVDGIKVFPVDDFDGDDDLGVHHEDFRNYNASNRWIVEQPLTIDATEDPENPNAPWPAWLLLQDGMVPVTRTLPPKGQAPPIEAEVDGTDIAPGTYSGWVRYRSDLSGPPPAEVTRKIYFDHSREVFEDLVGLPEHVVLEPGDDPYERILDVSPIGGTIIKDLDVITDLDVGISFDTLDWQISLQGPTGPAVFLKELTSDPFRTVWDDETDRPASGGLVNFDGLLSDGLWTLQIENLEGSEANLEFEMQRFHVRLHHEDAPPCE